MVLAYIIGKQLLKSVYCFTIVCFINKFTADTLIFQHKTVIYLKAYIVYRINYGKQLDYKTRKRGNILCLV